MHLEHLAKYSLKSNRAWEPENSEEPSPSFQRTGSVRGGGAGPGEEDWEFGGRGRGKDLTGTRR